MIPRDPDEDLELEDDEPTYSVLLRRRQSWSFPEVSTVLREAADVAMADAARIAKTGPGIVLSGVPRDVAKAAVLGLRALEVDCFLVPDATLFSPPVPCHLEAMELGDGGIRAIMSASGGMSFGHVWLDVAYIAVALITSTSPGGDVYTATRRATTGSLTQRKQVLSFAPQPKKGAFHALDVYCGFTQVEPGAGPHSLLHVHSTMFDFGCLGERRRPRASDNVIELTRQLTRRAPHAALSEGARAAVDGGDPNVENFAHLSAFRDDCLWQLDLLELERRKRQGAAGRT